MSTLSSSSTYTEIVNAYLDASSYIEDASVEKCLAFITACTMLIRLPAETRVGGSGGQGQEMKFDLATLREELAYARAWHDANKTVTGGRTTFGDFSNFRD